MEQFEQSGGNMSAMSMHEMLMNIAQFRAQAMGMTALGSGDEDADLREALARSVQESESKPSLPPPASLKAIGTLRSNKYSRVVCCPLLFVCPSTCPRPPPPNPPLLLLNPHQLHFLANQMLAPSHHAQDNQPATEFMHPHRADVLQLHGKDENCVICTEAYQLGEDVTKMPCQHLFHKACLTPWLQNTNSCPVRLNHRLPL